jgi:hypothetical protein
MSSLLHRFSQRAELEQQHAKRKHIVRQRALVVCVLFAE